jgi:endoglucanase
VSATVTSTLREATFERAVSVLVLYNIPGRDCGSYSAGGAENTADYETWIDAIAGAIGRQKVVIILEPDALADLPSDCGYDPTQVNIPQATADRYTQINYALRWKPDRRRRSTWMRVIVTGRRCRLWRNGSSRPAFGRRRDFSRTYRTSI